MEKSLKNKIKDILPPGSSKELVDSVHEFVQSREKLAFISARIPFSFGPIKIGNPQVLYHYKDEQEYLNTPE
jgi:hypothetical protein